MVSDCITYCMWLLSDYLDSSNWYNNIGHKFNNSLLLIGSMSHMCEAYEYPHEQ